MGRHINWSISYWERASNF